MTKETDDGDNSQFWAWNDDNDSLRNKDGMALPWMFMVTLFTLIYFDTFNASMIFCKAPR